MYLLSPILMSSQGLGGTGGSVGVGSPVCMKTFDLNEKVCKETYHKLICCAFDDIRHFGAAKGACEKVNVFECIAFYRP